jgi:hypothetical protein
MIHFYTENEFGFPVLKHKNLEPTNFPYNFVIQGKVYGYPYNELVIWVNGVNMHLIINKFGIQECIQVGFCEYS